jgi:Zn-dependent oligopeptidase
MTNPFFEDWTAPYQAPPLDRIKAEHFAPAYDRALVEHTAEIVAIAENPQPPGFDNVVLALEKSGQLLGRIEGVFHNLASSCTDEALQAIELEMAPRLSAHWSAISMHPVLFARLDAVYTRRESLGLDSESLRVLERYHLDFVRAGAQLKGRQRDRLAAIAQRLAVLGTQFSQNVLGDEGRMDPAADASADGGRTGFHSRRCRRQGEGSGYRRALRHHFVALQRRAIPAICRGPGPARTTVPRLDRARRQRECPQQHRPHHRDAGAAGRTGWPVGL